MALFFDGNWFDRKLEHLGLNRDTVAAALGLSLADLELVWKDQRELSARDVGILAGLLGVTPREIADKAGVSTPVPPVLASLAELERRLAHVEEKVAELAAQLAARK